MTYIRVPGKTGQHGKTLSQQRKEGEEKRNCNHQKNTNMIIDTRSGGMDKTPPHTQWKIQEEIQKNKLLHMKGYLLVIMNYKYYCDCQETYCY